jgi:hypothetical protein
VVGPTAAPGGVPPKPPGRGPGRRPTRQPAGRPTLLTPQLEAQLVAQVKRVGALSLAARCCGVTPAAVLDWCARGRGTNRHDRPPTPATVRFVRAIEKAQAEFQASRVELIHDAAKAKPECWTAAAWTLERLDPDTWGRRDRVDVSGQITVTEVRGLLVAMIGVMERYVPAERRETEFANLLAEARQFGGDRVDPVPLPRSA